MKRIIALLLAALLALPAFGAAAESKEDSYFFGENIYGILHTGERALEDGMDPAWVVRQMKDAADEQEYGEAFAALCENIAAYDGGDYRKISAALEKGNELRSVGYYNSSYNLDYRWNGYTPYDCPDVSDAMRSALKDSKAQYCFEAAWWRESEFQSVFGTSYANFKPSHPRPGYVCVVIRKGAQIAPETDWEGIGDGMQEPLFDTIDRLAWRLEDDGPVFTGNPNLASSFWVFDMKYPFYAYYGTDGEIKGYNCKVTLTAEAADTKKKIASISGSEQLPDRISSWSNGVARADVPDLTGISGYEDFVSSVHVALVKERSAAMANEKITAGNYKKKLNAFLVEQAEKTDDPWEKAIYQSEVRGADWDSGTVTFSLRSFDPDLSEMPEYMRGENPGSWLDEALSHFSGRRLDLSLKVVTGVFTHTSLTAVRKAVSAAAAKAREAFEGRDMLTAFRDRFFRVPGSGGTLTADQLLDPDDGFRDWAYDVADMMPGFVPTSAVASLFAAQKGQNLITADGPAALALECVGADPAQLLSDTAKSALDSMAFSPRSQRYDGDTEDFFLRVLADKALEARKNARYSLTLPVDPGEGSFSFYPSEYRSYLSAFRYGDALEQFQESAALLPDIAAQPFPKSGRLSGGTTGTQVNLKISERSQPTYVQIRRESDDRIAATAFVHPGSQVTVRVPSALCRIYYCSGPYWYGEEIMFGDAGSYNKSEPVQIEGSDYIHTFRLEIVDDGNTTTYRADPSEFRK